MQSIRILAILLFIGGSTFAQMFPAVSAGKPPQLTIQSKDLGTLTQSGTAGTDSVRLTVNTRRVTIDSVKSDNGVTADIYDSLLVYGDTLWNIFTYDKSTVGSFTDYWYVYHTGYGSPDTSTITYSIASAYNLIAETSMDFDTVSASTTDYLTISNSSEEPIGSITYSGLASPFTLSNTVSTLDADSEHDILVTFSAVENGTYYDTLIITSTADNSPVSVPMVGVWSADTIPSSSQWLAASPGGGGWWRKIHFDPVSERLHLVGDLGGHAYSDDYGLSWSYGSGFTTYEHSSLDILPGGDTVLVGTSAGIFRSVDGGESFIREGEGEIYSTLQYHSNETSNNYAIGGINYHPANSNIIFAGTGFNHDVERAGPNPAKIFKSTDGGATWATSSTGIETANNAFGWFSGSTVSTDTVYAASRQGLYRSVNGGANWSITTKTSYTRSVAVHPFNANKVVVAEGYWTGARLLYSTNGFVSSYTDIGQNVSLTYPRWKEVWYSATGDTIFASTDIDGSEIYMTTNEGSSFTAFATVTSGLRWDGSSAKATTFSITDDYQKIAIADDMFIYISTNGGTTWYSGASESQGSNYYTSRGTEIIVTVDVAFCPQDEDIILMAVSDHGMIKSIDGGYSWKLVGDDFSVSLDASDNSSHFDGGDFNGNAGRAVVWDKNNAGTAYAMVGDNDASDITFLFKTTDYGDSWTRIVNNLPVGNYGELAINSSGRLFTASYYSYQSEPAMYIAETMQYSDNGGVTWTEAQGGYYWMDIQIYQGNENIMYATKQAANDGSGGLYKSTNGGSSWSSVNNASYGYLSSVAIHPTNSNFIYLAQGGKSTAGKTDKPTGIYKSTDGGSNITKVLTPDSTSYTYAKYTTVRFDPADASKIYASMGRHSWRTDYNVGDGLKMSADSGSTWTSLNYNLARTSIEDFAVSSNGKFIVCTPGAGGFMLDKVTPTAPIISTFLAEGDGINQEIDVTVNYSNSELGLYAYADISTSKATLFDGADDNYVMTATASQATYTFASIDTSQKYYLQSIVGNIIGRDTSSIDSVEFNTEVAVVDTFYPAETWDDVYRAYSTGFYGNYNYNNMGYLGTDVKAGVRFRNVNDFSRIDSAKIEFTAYQVGTTTIDMTVWGEDNSNPLVFSTYSDFDARTLTTDSSTALQNYSTNWSTDGTYLIDVTDIVTELMGSYTYSNGSMAFLIHPKAGHTMTGSVSRTFYGYEYNSGEKKAKLIIWGTQ